MPRREYRSGFTCAESGCRETQWLVHDTRADQAGAHRRQKERPFKCTRHADPAGNLKPGNEQTRHVLVATRLPSRLPDRYPYNLKPPEERKWLKGLFWVPEGGDSGSGFTFGPGFNAHATDFPEGTRLVVTAQILPPEEDEPEPVDGDCPESKLPTGAHGSDWYGGGRCSWCGDLGPLEEFNA